MTLLRGQLAPYQRFALAHYADKDPAHDAGHIRRILARCDQLAEGLPAPSPTGCTSWPASAALPSASPTTLDDNSTADLYSETALDRRDQQRSGGEHRGPRPGPGRLAGQQAPRSGASLQAEQ